MEVQRIINQLGSLLLNPEAISTDDMTVIRTLSLALIAAQLTNINDHAANMAESLAYIGGAVVGDVFQVSTTEAS